MTSSDMRSGGEVRRVVCLDFGQDTGTIKQSYEGIFIGGIKSLVVDVRVYGIHMLHVCTYDFSVQRDTDSLLNY